MQKTHDNLSNFASATLVCCIGKFPGHSQHPSSPLPPHPPHPSLGADCSVAFRAEHADRLPFGHQCGQPASHQLYAQAVQPGLLRPPVLHVCQGGRRRENLWQNQHLGLSEMQAGRGHSGGLHCQQPAGSGLPVVQHSCCLEGQ